jgi:outer membrane receptor protein involved in Fe transport
MAHSTKGRGLEVGVSALAMLAALSWAGVASAQATSAVRGHVEGAAAGSTVTLTDATTGQQSQFQVDASGNFYASGLRPGAYHVVVAGGEARDVVVPVGETVTLEFGAPEGEIVVTAQRRVETRTATVGTNVSQFQMETLPQNDRNFLNFAALAPGVTVSPDPTQRRFQAGAIASDNVNVFIDGESYKNQTGHGGIAGQAFSAGNPFPQSAVQEFRVDTQNYGAQYEQAASAVINAVTRTGGDELHGGAFVQYVPRQWLGQPHFQRDTPRPDYERRQFGFDLGGPLGEDFRFFFAYEGSRQTNPSSAVEFLLPSERGSTVTPTPEYLALRTAESGIFPAEFQQDLFFGKLTWFATRSDTVDASVYLRREDDERDFGRQEGRSHGRQLGNDFDEYLLRWQHRGDGWLNALSWAYQQTATGTPRLTSSPETVITAPTGPDIDPPVGPDNIGDTIAAFGGHFFDQQNGQEIYTLRDNVTFERGGHVVNMGAKVAWNGYHRFEHWFTNGTYRYSAAAYTGAATDLPINAQISRRPETQSQDDNTQIGLYIQDDWTLDDHWTVNLGLRWDYETNMFNNNYVTPANIATALRNYVGWQAAGIDAEDYISDGNDRDAFTGAFQPRFGLSYDVHGDRSLVIFGGAGRYYDRNVYLTAAIEEQINDFRSDVLVSFQQNAADLDVVPGTCDLVWSPGLADPDALRTAVLADADCAATGGSVWLLNDETEVPYTDAFDIGVRGSWGDIQYSVTLAHNVTKNIFMYVRGNRMPDGSFSPLGDAWVIDNFPAAGQLPGFNGKLNIGQNDGESEYNALYFVLNRPFTDESGYGFTAALTLSDATTNIGMELGSDEFFGGPRVDIFGEQNVQGLDRWRFVGTSIVALPWEFMLSGTLTLASGPAYGRVTGFGAGPPNSCCQANLGGAQFPDDDIGFKNLDIRIARTFQLWNGQEITPELGIFNVFDNVNRVYSSWGGRENNTVGNARTFQVGVRYEF